MLQFYPYHIDALMQLAEVHSIRGGELERAGDMYERALYARERSFHSDFRPWAADGQPPNGMHCSATRSTPRTTTLQTRASLGNTTVTTGVPL